MFIKPQPKMKTQEVTPPETVKKTHGARVKKKNEMDAEEYQKVCERMKTLRDSRKKKLNEISTQARPTKEIIKEVIKEVPVDRIVEKIVDREVPVEKIVEKIVEKEVPIEKVVEKVVYKHKDKDPFEDDDYKHLKNEMSEMRSMMTDLKGALMPKPKEQPVINKPVTKMIYRPFGGFTPY